MAHPFDSRAKMRAWELRMEQQDSHLEIVNPFYDITREDVDPIDMGRAGRYELLDPQTLVNRDIDAITRCAAVLAIIDGSVSYGTIMEIVYAKCLDVPVYIVCTNDQHDHPWLKFHATRIFKSLNEFEQWLIGYTLIDKVIEREI